MDTIILAVEVIALLGILIAILYVIYKVLCIAITISISVLYLSTLVFTDYIITPFEEKRRRKKKEGLRAGGQTFIGYILIFIGVAIFVYYLWQCIILKNLYWGKCPIIELAWPFVSGVLLIITDVPLGVVPKPGLDAKVCNDCAGKGKIKTGEKEIYKRIDGKVQCRNCKGIGREEYYDDRIYRNRPNYIPMKEWRTCSSCDGKGYHIKSEYISFIPPRIVPVFSSCSICEGTGYTGKHVEEITKRNKIKGGLILSRTISLLYGIYLVLLFFLFISN